MKISVCFSRSIWNRFCFCCCCWFCQCSAQAHKSNESKRKRKLNSRSNVVFLHSICRFQNINFCRDTFRHVCFATCSNRLNISSNSNRIKHRIQAKIFSKLRIVAVAVVAISDEIFLLGKGSNGNRNFSPSSLFHFSPFERVQAPPKIEFTLVLCSTLIFIANEATAQWTGKNGFGNIMHIVYTFDGVVAAWNRFFFANERIRFTKDWT